MQKPVAKEKIQARKKYWSSVQSVQDEVNKQWIHNKLQPKEVAQHTRLSEPTVKRFMRYGGSRPYNFMYGPYATTIFAMADAVGFELRLVRSNK